MKMRWKAPTKSTRLCQWFRTYNLEIKPFVWIWGFTSVGYAHVRLSPNTLLFWPIQTSLDSGGMFQPLQSRIHRSGLRIPELLSGGWGPLDPDILWHQRLEGPPVLPQAFSDFRGFSTGRRVDEALGPERNSSWIEICRVSIRIEYQWIQYHILYIPCLYIIYNYTC